VQDGTRADEVDEWVVGGHEAWGDNYIGISTCRHGSIGGVFGLERATGGCPREGRHGRIIDGWRNRMGSKVGGWGWGATEPGGMCHDVP
jgi:hypothetical protein